MQREISNQMRKWKEFKLTNLLTPDVASCMRVRCHQVQNYGSMRNVERGARSMERRAWSKEWGAWSKSEEHGAWSKERGGAKIEINAGWLSQVWSTKKWPHPHFFCLGLQLMVRVGIFFSLYPSNLYMKRYLCFSLTVKKLQTISSRLISSLQWLKKWPYPLLSELVEMDSKCSHTRKTSSCNILIQWIS